MMKLLAVRPVADKPGRLEVMSLSRHHGIKLDWLDQVTAAELPTGAAVVEICTETGSGTYSPRGIGHKGGRLESKSSNVPCWAVNDVDYLAGNFLDVEISPGSLMPTCFPFLLAQSDGGKVRTVGARIDFAIRALADLPDLELESKILNLPSLLTAARNMELHEGLWLPVETSHQQYAAVELLKRLERNSWHVNLHLLGTVENVPAGCELWRICEWARWNHKLGIYENSGQTKRFVGKIQEIHQDFKC